MLLESPFEIVDGRVIGDQARHRFDVTQCLVEHPLDVDAVPLAWALVKLYADEDGHTAVRRLTDIVVSVLSRVEVPAALWHKHRLGELDAADTQLLVAEFEADYFGTADDPPKLTAVVVDSSVLDQAARMVAVHGLRAYDAVQLATGLAVRHIDAACNAFAAFDHDLRRAAAVEGFTLVP